jgi:alpha,alpha-trehalose phosphorylase
LELAYDDLGETAFIDLRDLAFNTRDGVHLAALSGTWLAVVAGFSGMRDYMETLSFAPQLPSRIGRLSFGLLYRGRRLRVDVRPDRAHYELLDGEPIEILHHGERLTVTASSPQSRPVPVAPQRPAPPPPRGRRRLSPPRTLDDTPPQDTGSHRKLASSAT